MKYKAFPGEATSTTGAHNQIGFRRPLLELGASLTQAKQSARPYLLYLRASVVDSLRGIRNAIEFRLNACSRWPRIPVV